jgi:hypothetical protein
MSHSNEITAEVIESTFGRQGGAVRFANFCNAVIIAEGANSACGLPVLSEKPGADGCLDGEWDIPTSEPAVTEASTNPFSLPGWNVYQFKARGITGGGRSKAVSSLKSSVRASIRDLVARLVQPKVPTQYVLFTNLQLGLESSSTTKAGAALSQDRADLEAAILDGTSESVSIQIVDATQLAALVNKHPALRLTYFSAPTARTWDEKWAEEQNAKNYKVPIQPALVGRETELAEVTRWLAEGETKVIAISGPSGMGKTRLGLESTRQYRFRTTVVELVDEFESWGLGSFGTSPQPRIVIIEDPDEDQARRLAKQAISCSGLKLILTFPSEAKAPCLKLTEDPAIKLLVLRPLPREQSEKLITAVGAKFDRNALDWILRQAGGIPEILLSAAELGPQLRDKSGDLQAKLAEAYRKRIETELGLDAVRALRLVSSLQWAKVTGENPDLPVLIKTVGAGQNVPQVSDNLKRLEKLGYVRRRGDHVSVVPPLFAAALVEEVVASQFAEILALFDRLGDAARKRFLERVITTNIGEESKLWDHVFTSAFGTGDRLLANLDFLDYVGRAVPQRTARFLMSQLEGLEDILREGSYSSQRGTLLSTFRGLAYEAESCAAGMRLLQGAALCEAGGGDTSAMERFCECFVHWNHPFPMSFHDRERWLLQMLESHDPTERRLGARALITATAPPHHLGGYAHNTRRLGVPPPNRLWREVHDYLAHLIELRFDLSCGGDQSVADFVQEKFVNVFHELRNQLPPDRFLALFEKFVNWQASGRLKADEREIRKVIHWIEKDYITASKQPGAAEHAEKWKTVLERVTALRARFDQGSYIVRLRIALGNAFDAEWEEHNGKRLYSFDKRCQVLAQEAVSQPALLDDEGWAVVNNSQSHQLLTFLVALGEFDKAHLFLDRLEASAGDARGEYNFACYLSGLHRQDAGFVDTRVEELMSRPKFPKIALLNALKSTGPTEGNRRRLLALIAEQAVAPPTVATMFTYGKWLDDLPSSEVRTILEYVASEPDDWPKQIVHILSLYLHADKALPRELIPIAERALNQLEIVGDSLDWECGQVAIGIGKSDFEKALELLKRQAGALKTAGWDRKTWTPFSEHRSKDFWQFVRDKDPSRAYRELLVLEGMEDKHEIGLLLDLEHHRDVIQKIATEDESKGIFFAGLVSGAQKDFFPFAYALMQTFPRSEGIRSELASAAAYSVGSGEFSFGTEVDKFQQARTAIESELKSPNTPAECRPWLEQVLSRVQTALKNSPFRDRSEDYLGWD